MKLKNNIIIIVFLFTDNVLMFQTDKCAETCSMLRIKTLVTGQEQRNKLQLTADIYVPGLVLSV